MPVREHFGRSMLLGQLNLKVPQVYCLQTNGLERGFDVTFTSAGILDDVLETCRRRAGERLFSDYEVVSLDRPNFKIVTVQMYNPFVTGAQISGFLSGYGDVLSVDRRVYDGLGFWTGKTSFQVLLREDPNGIDGMVHPPAQFNIAGDKGFLYYNRQPPFCRKCRVYGHGDGACNFVRCGRPSCRASGHESRDCPFAFVDVSIPTYARMAGSGGGGGAGRGPGEAPLPDRAAGSEAEPEPAQGAEETAATEEAPGEEGVAEGASVPEQGAGTVGATEEEPGEGGATEDVPVPEQEAEAPAATEEEPGGGEATEEVVVPESEAGALVGLSREVVPETAGGDVMEFSAVGEGVAGGGKGGKARRKRQRKRQRVGPEGGLGSGSSGEVSLAWDDDEHSQLLVLGAGLNLPDPVSPQFCFVDDVDM